MPRRILILNGHPDPRPERLCAALCAAYAEGARAAGHEVTQLDVGALDFPLVRTADEFIDGVPTAVIQDAEEKVRWAEHTVVVFPLWLGGPPAVLKGFFEQVFRYGLAIPRPAQGSPLKGLLAGRTARTVVTMGMPGMVYRLGFGAFGVRGLERGVLWLSGYRPIRRTLIGGLGDTAAARPWPDRMRRLGRAGR